MQSRSLSRRGARGGTACGKFPRGARSPFRSNTIIKTHIAPMAVFIQLGVDPSVAMVFIRLRYELSELSKLSKLACVPTRPKPLKTLAWL